MPFVSGCGWKGHSYQPTIKFANSSSKNATYRIAEYHSGRLQSTPLGKLCTDAYGPPFKTILELVLWNGRQSCHCITPDVINVIKMTSFQYFLYLREQKKVTGE
jgi:hypothetical protein